MVLSVKLFEFPRNVIFRVISAEPERSLVGENTRVILRTSALRAGVAANMVTFDDVGGLANEIEEIRELVECPIKLPQVYEHLGIDAPRGSLLRAAGSRQNFPGKSHRQRDRRAPSLRQRPRAGELRTRRHRGQSAPGF